MLTREETIRIFEICHCGAGDCEDCPRSTMECKGFEELSSAVLHYLKSGKENEPAPAATGTSSEVSVKEDTDNIHLNDSTLLDICQEELKAITVIALNDYPNGYLTGYIVALKKNIERLRGEHSD
jgi:hypothetical protein